MQVFSANDCHRQALILTYLVNRFLFLCCVSRVFIQVSEKACGHPLCQHTSTAWILVRPRHNAVSSSTCFSRTGTNSLSQFPTLILHSSSSTDLYHVHSRLKQKSEGRPFSQLPTLPVLCMEDERERGEFKEIVSLTYFKVAQWVKNMPAIQEMQIRSLGWEDTLEKEMAAHSQYSCLKNPMDREAWWTIVYGVQRVRHDCERK